MALSKNLIERTVAGIVFVLVMLGAIIFNNYATSLFFGMVAFIGLYEFFTIVKVKIPKIAVVPNTLFAFSAYVIIALVEHLQMQSLILLLLCLPALIIIWEIFFEKGQRDIARVGFTVFAIFYISVPFGLLNFLNYKLPGGDLDYRLLLAFFILIWTNDTMAYVTGRLVGKNKMAETISPKKTWEGFAGGIAFTIVAASIMAWYWNAGYLPFILIAFVVAIMGTIGDLSESVLKRWAGVKDSGNIIPGHGGILDRFDGVLLTSPMVIFIIFYIDSFL